MNCLECATLMAATYQAPAALACCVHCGAGICLDHARLLILPAQPVGPVPRRGARRIMCATCHIAAYGDGAVALTVPVERGEQQSKRKLAALMSMLAAWNAQRRR